MGQHCTGQNSMQGPKQLCKRKNHVQCCLYNLGTTLHRSKSYAILAERLQTTLHMKNPVQCSLNSPETTLHRKSSMQCCTRGSKQYCTGKTPGNVVWTTSGHSVYIITYISGPSLQKNIKLSFLLYENRLTS